MADKIRVLYICTDAKLGGSTQSLWQMIESIKDNIDPIVLLPAKEESYDFFTKHGIICIVHPFPYIVSAPPSWAYWKNVFLHPWRLRCIKRMRGNISTAIAVRRVLNGEKIDIIHSNTTLSTIGIILSKILRAKHIWHVREFMDLDFQMYIEGGLNRLNKIINNADARIVISNAVKERRKLRNKNTYVLLNPIRKKGEICYESNKDKVILFVAYRVTKLKGVEVAISAFANSKEWERGFKLKIVGNIDADYKNKLLNIIRELNILPYVVFVNATNDIKSYFKTASAYIMSSEFEALGRVTAEAMFFGCPVIAKATGGTLDLIKHGETGYLFKTINECSQLLRKVCEEDQKSLVLCAQNFAINNLSQEVYGPKILEIYNKTIQSYL